jgi:4-amino-4-deoxy-L-arabinose transferase-like glycosyltransferase
MNDTKKNILFNYRKLFIVVTLGFIVVSAFSLRAGHIYVILNGHKLKEMPINADSRQYLKYGYNLAYKNLYSMEFPSPNPKPDSFRSPGYPLLLALCMRLTDDTSFIPLMLFLQVIIGTLTVILTYLLAKHFISENLSLIAAFLVGLSPHLITMSGYLLTETLAGFLLVAALLTYNSALKGGKLFCFAFAGLLFGWGYITNETFLFLPFLLGCLTLFESINPPFIKKENLLPVIIFLSIFCIFPAVWITRNLLTVPTDAPSSYNRAIKTMSHGAYPGFIHESVEKKYYPYSEDPLQPQFGSSIHSFSKILWQRFQQRPFRYLSWYIVEKPFYFWSWNILQGQGDVFIYSLKTSLYHESRLADITKGMMKKLHWVILLLLLAGIPVLIVKWRNSGYQKSVFRELPVILYVTCLYFTLIYTVFAPWPRYSIMLRPELYLCAVWSGTAITKLFLNRWRRRNTQ